MELVAVIAIITVLTSLLTSALNQTKARGHRMTCLNNLRQLQVSWFLYADDNDERLALNRTEPSVGLSILLGKRNSTNSWVVGNPKEDLTTDKLRKGSLFPYVKSEAVYRCPADQSKVFVSGNLSKTRRNRSYSMSAYMNGDNAGSDPKVKTRYSDLASPSTDQMFVFIEEHQDTPWNGAFSPIKATGISLSAVSFDASTPSDRHSMGCNLSFADGHVERWRWLERKGFNLATRFSVANSKDMARLYRATPDP